MSTIWTNRSESMENTEVKAYVVEKGTGLITDELKSGDRIIKGKSIDYLNAKKKIKETTQEWKIEHFYKGHIEEIKKVMAELNVYEKAFLYSIAVYVGYEDCCLKYENGNDITTDDLIHLTGLSRSTLFDTINNLSKKDIIYKGKNSKNRQFFVNPWLFCKGNRINKVLKTMFKNYRIRILDGKRWKDLKGDLP
jgi:hypothetical protein